MKPYGDCIYCGGEVRERSERVDYRFHGQLFILENVPTGVCNQCGEKYFTAEIAKQMEDAVRCIEAPVSTIAVPVIRIPGHDTVCAGQDSA
ncbi:MAG: YgiT-type zinc finger protein [Candidatus Coatesbacteria bacterium]|nr:YgiT-type zinc finger protein [Candidatus Coatesbacteria bacterium]